jgi:hypothetical protein
MADGHFVLLAVQPDNSTYLFISNGDYDRAAEEILFPGNKKVRFLIFFIPERQILRINQSIRLAVTDNSFHRVLENRSLSA